MTHIAIEGPDGVGKTTTAKELARRLGFCYIEKPLHFFTDAKDATENYKKITQYINQNTDLEFRALLYGAGVYHTSRIATQKDIVTDRHLCTLYTINLTNENKALFDHLATACGKPDLTVILYADAEVRRKRILGRNAQDPDLWEKIIPNSAYQKFREFVETYHMPYLWLDNSGLSLEETVSSIQKNISI